MEYKQSDRRNYTSEKLAEIFSFLSLATTLFMTVILPYVFAPIAIIFAYFSKGKTKAMTFRAKLAIALSIFSLVINSALIGFSFYYVNNNAEAHAMTNQMYEQLFGQSYDDFMSGTYPELNSVFGNQ